MSYREIPEDRILSFKPTPGFKGYGSFFTDDSVAHPAKMNLNLLKWILKNHTMPSEVVLDPMAGTGSTVVLAALEGRHGVAVEYEPKFCEMVQDNIELTRKQAILKPKGQMVCIQGDARKLSSLLKRSDVIVVSPPYSLSLSHRGQNFEEVRKKLLAQGYSEEYIKASWNQPHQCQRWGEEAYGKNPENVGNLAHGDIDAIVASPPYGNRLADPAVQDGDQARMSYRQTVDMILTSPPYGEAQSGGGIAIEGYQGSKHSPTDLVGKRSYMPDKFEEGNISRLAFGDVDAVITSPPYEAVCLDGRDIERRVERLREAGYDPKDFVGGRGRNVTLKEYDHADVVITSPPYSGSETEVGGDKGKRGGDSRLRVKKNYVRVTEKNIGQLPQGDIDAVVTSPPYESTRAFHDIDFMKNIVHEQNLKIKRGEIKGNYRTDEAELKYLEKIEAGKIEDEDNVGSMKGETYLSAMLKIYRECLKVLRSGGKMVLVVRNFIRNKQVVRLDLDTIKLCEAAGFKLADRWYFRIPTKSFWRILYRKKFPEVPEVEFEDILIFRKN